MLVKMGKVRITDVAIAEEEFKKFDVSGDGWLTREDLAMLQDNKTSSDPVQVRTSILYAWGFDSWGLNTAQ